VKQYLNEKQVDLTPQCMIASKTAVDSLAPPKFVKKVVPGVTDSFLDFHVERNIHEFKETVLNVAESGYNERCILVYSVI
jgi:hypothetical protein